MEVIALKLLFWASLQTISENKLKAFSVGLMNAGLKKTSKVKQDLEIKKKVSFHVRKELNEVVDCVSKART